MNGKIKFVALAIVMVPLVYITLPFINATGCRYKSYIETKDVISYGICYRGFLRTITFFKDSGLTVSRTMLTSYRSPFLTTITLDKEVVIPPKEISNSDSLKIFSSEYLTPTVVRYHIERADGQYIYIMRPTQVNTPPVNNIYKVALEGEMSHWE
ncbi:hypothetical protein [Aeromonas jandaei]|uniref:hypothetical protein n=1 Tax=Aeromonas jandaei TaxID=650 RepID=UPI001ABF25AA|nr:hypothetical protein [Aeromonas jandaei]QSR71979.1 hypothetical protein GP488_05835 [Aeromonas jandaei]